MPLSEDARRAGKEAAARGRVVLAEKLAAVLRRDEELASTAVEVGLVDRAWMEEPGQHPISTASSLDVVERFLERSSERRPSLASRLGLETDVFVRTPAQWAAIVKANPFAEMAKRDPSHLVVLVARGALSNLLRQGVPGARSIGGNEIFDIRTRLQRAVRFV